MHVALVSMDGHKMSKSRGNLVFVDKLRTQHDPRAIRLGLIEHHYRVEWEWDDGLMKRNEQRLALWSTSVEGGVADDAILNEVRQALDNDLDTPTVISLIDDAARRGHNVRGCAALLGVVI
jgi:L-cysteine:1D-myo-inositol 2-amino-2-deoxy-alpha-D-glucopyranoside ligase